MSAKPRKNTPRFNTFSVGRAAVLFRNGKTREQVIQHYLKAYGAEWNIHSASEMEKYLFHPSQGMRPNFAKLFENRFPTEIEDNFSGYFRRKDHWNRSKRQAMVALGKNPEHLAHRVEGVKKRESNPDFQQKRREQLASPAFRKVQRKSASKEMKRRWNDPKLRAQMIERTRIRNTEELKARWADPERRRQMIERSRKPRKKRK